MNRENSNGFTSIASFFLAVYYIWYALPFMKITFRAEVFKYLFFSCFAVGICFLCIARILHQKMRFLISVRVTSLTPVIIYMVVLSVLCLFHIADATNHIRVSFTFWGTLIVYQLFAFDRNAQVHFGRFLLILFLLTSLTSLTAVVSDSSAARAIANASQRPEAIARDYELMKKNVSGVYLFQCLTIFSPVPVLMLCRKKKVLLGSALLCIIILAILKASFTISLFVLVVACVTAAAFNYRTITKLFLPVCGMIILFLPMDTLFFLLSNIIENQYIRARILEIALFFQEHSVQGDLQLRLQCYLYSLRTFIVNPLGVGPWYSYHIGEHGIGYHSAMIDDVARYGVFALAFYGMFLKKYYQLLQEQWRKIGFESAVFPMLLAWVLFLLLNIGFRSADESIFMLYILPVLPDALRSRALERERSV